MEPEKSEKEIKTNPSLVVLIFITIAVVSIFAFDKVKNSQGEEKITLPKQGEENLSEPIVSKTEPKVVLPPIGSTPKTESIPSPTPTSPQLPPMLINKEIKYQAVLNTTEGKMVVDLDTTHTPFTSNNFIYLAKRNFYDSTIFHRVIKGFMIQGGDPLGNGSGGPGYRFADEPFASEYTRGTVAMANAGPNTNGSQFFILHQDYPLPRQYVIFGKVVEGLDVLDKIAGAPTTISPTGENSKPVNPVKIESVEIIETPATTL